MKTAEYPKTPALDKMKSVKDESQIIGAFLDQLSQEGIQLAERDSRGDLQPLNQSIEKTLAKYFEIDLEACEEERCAILEHIRATR